MWAVLKKKYGEGKGYKIGKFDLDTAEWSVDDTQPVGTGWGKLSVDSKGQPALTSFLLPRNIFYKEQEKWTEMEACSKNVAFGANDFIYRLGCDKHVYLWYR